MISHHTISSSHNQQFKRWVSLLTSRGIKRHHQCLISGTKLRKEITNNPTISVEEFLLPPSCRDIEELPSKIPSYELAPKLFNVLDVFGTKEPLVVCQVPDISSMNLTHPPQGMEVLCPIGDPGNLGALLRSCWAFGARTVVLLQEAAHPFHPKVIRASSGAVFEQSLRWGGPLANLNKTEILRWITALDFQGTNLAEWEWKPNVRLLIGEEGTGVPRYNFSERLQIPQYHPSIPLNATIAGSVALFAYRQKYSQT